MKSFLNVSVRMNQVMVVLVPATKYLKISMSLPAVRLISTTQPPFMTSFKKSVVTRRLNLRLTPLVLKFKQLTKKRLKKSKLIYRIVGFEGFCKSVQPCHYLQFGLTCIQWIFTIFALCCDVTRNRKGRVGCATISNRENPCGWCLRLGKMRWFVGDRFLPEPLKTSFESGDAAEFTSWNVSSP